MSTQLMNDAGEPVALRYSGGAERGPQADVAMPRSVAAMVGSMPVHEEPTPDYRSTLAMWINDLAFAGYTVRYAGETV